MKSISLKASLVISLLTLGLAACSTVEDKPIPEVQALAPLSIDDGTRRSSSAFSKLAMRLDSGEVVGARRDGAVCNGRKLLAGDRISDTLQRRVKEIFHDEAGSQGYATVNMTDSLFQDATELSVDYLVGAGVIDMTVNYCRESYGESYIKLAWQIFDPTTKKIVHETESEGIYRTEKTSKETSARDLMAEAFRAATRNLLADRQYHALMASKKGTGS